MDIVNIEELAINLSEALSPSQHRLVDKWLDRIEDDGDSVPFDVHDHVFAHYNKGDETAKKIILPFSGSSSSAEPFNAAVAKHLHENGGWTIHDYQKGKAIKVISTKKSKKVVEKNIGAILQETGGDNHFVTATTVHREEGPDGRTIKSEKTSDIPLTQAFAQDPTRQATRKNDLQVVISRDPYDVAGMSSGRGWRSCMTLPGDEKHDRAGEFHEHVMDDLRHKTLVAYLTPAGDDNVERPLSRMLLKRHTNSTEEDIWRPEEKVYGASSNGFQRTVNNFAKQMYPAAPRKTYNKHPDLYDDDGRRRYTEGDAKKHTDLTDLMGYEDITHNSVMSHNLDSDGKFHSVNDEPAIHYKDHIGNEIKAWYKHGALHRDHGNAYERYDNDGNLTYHRTFKNGHEHADKDEAYSSIMQRHDYVELTHKKFGKEHNSPITGVSSITSSPRHITVTKHYYGQLHTDDDLPSATKIEYHDNGTISEDVKKWHKHGEIVKAHEERTYPNGSLWQFKHIENGRTHSWLHGEGTINQEKNGLTHNITYNHNKPLDNPSAEHIHEESYTNGMGDYYSPKPGVPAYRSNTDRSSKILYTDEHGNTHKEDGYAQDYKTVDHNGNITHLARKMMVHGKPMHNAPVGTHIIDMFDRNKELGEFQKVGEDAIHHVVYSSYNHTHEPNKFDIVRYKKLPKDPNKTYYESDKKDDIESALLPKPGSANHFEVVVQNHDKYPRKIESSERIPLSGYDVKTIKKGIGNHLNVFNQKINDNVSMNILHDMGTKVALRHKNGKLMTLSYDRNGNYTGSRIGLSSEDAIWHHNSTGDIKTMKPRSLEQREQLFNETAKEFGFENLEGITKTKLQDHVDKVNVPDIHKELKF